jgi:transcriptional regulator with XRE-family HTH domain
MTIDPMRPTQRGAIPADSFAARLMLARMHAGHLSIRDAAERCGLGRGAWTNWEKGALPGDIIGVATVIADKLGVDRDWLLFGGTLSQDESRRAQRAGGGAEQVNGRSTPISRSVPADITPRRAKHRPPARVSAGQRRPVSVRSPGYSMPSAHAA